MIIGMIILPGRENGTGFRPAATIVVGLADPNRATARF
jgi:hypothetical protein